MDCLGCGNSVDVCPGNPKPDKALQMVDLESQMKEADNWNWCVENVKTKQHLVDIQSNLKNSWVRRLHHTIKKKSAVCQAADLFWLM